MGAGDRWFKYEDKFGRSGTLQIWLDGNDSNSICERIKITAKEKDYSSTSKYLVFEVYNDGTGNSGSPYISIEDGNLNKIGGWAEGFTTTYSDNKMPAKGSGWKKIIIDLEKLKNNSNFDFSNIANIYLGYWASGDIYINDECCTHVLLYLPGCQTMVATSEPVIDEGCGGATYASDCCAIPQYDEDLAELTGDCDVGCSTC